MTDELHYIVLGTPGGPRVYLMDAELASPSGVIKTLYGGCPIIAVMIGPDTRFAKEDVARVHHALDQIADTLRLPNSGHLPVITDETADLGVEP